MENKPFLHDDDYSKEFRKDIKCSGYLEENNKFKDKRGKMETEPEPEKLNKLFIKSFCVCCGKTETNTNCIFLYFYLQLFPLLSLDFLEISHIHYMHMVHERMCTR